MAYPKEHVINFDGVHFSFLKKNFMVYAFGVISEKSLLNPPSQKSFLSPLFSSNSYIYLWYWGLWSIQASAWNLAWPSVCLDNPTLGVKKPSRIPTVAHTPEPSSLSPGTSMMTYSTAVSSVGPGTTVPHGLLYAQCPAQELDGCS